MPKKINIEERIGAIGFNSCGSRMTVVSYKNADNIWVKFDKGSPVHTSWNSFLAGSVKGAYDKRNFGIAYTGEGDYKPTADGKITPQYKSWLSMLERCYSKKHQERRPNYKGCSVAEIWHNFQNFAKWYDENHYQIADQEMNLDKDILVKGNKVYSPEVCVFVPKKINTLFIKSNTKRGNLPIGVLYRKDIIKNPYSASCGDGNGKQFKVGSFDKPEKAFEAYKTAKEKVIKQIAEEYKDRIPNKLYEAMRKYEVEITD